VIGYVIVWSLTLILLVGFVAYWVQRIERKHLTRMAAIDAAADADAEHFEADKRAWDAQWLAARDEYAALVAEIRAEIQSGDERGSQADEISNAAGETPAAVAR
jgi:hypothetical protein